MGEDGTWVGAEYTGLFGGGRGCCVGVERKGIEDRGDMGKGERDWEGGGEEAAACARGAEAGGVEAWGQGGRAPGCMCLYVCVHVCVHVHVYVYTNK